MNWLVTTKFLWNSFQELGKYLWLLMIFNVAWQLRVRRVEYFQSSLGTILSSVTFYEVFKKHNTMHEKNRDFLGKSGRSTEFKY